MIKAISIERTNHGEFAAWLWEADEDDESLLVLERVFADNAVDAARALIMTLPTGEGIDAIRVKGRTPRTAEDMRVGKSLLRRYDGSLADLINVAVAAMDEVVNEEESTPTIELYEKVCEELENDGYEAYVYYDYLGRATYGKTCPGIVTDAADLLVGAYLGRAMGDDFDKSMIPARSDSMGLSRIYY